MMTDVYGKPDEIVLSWEQAEELEDEYWELSSAERKALYSIVSDIDSGVISEQSEYDEAKKVTDKIQHRMRELLNLFENAVVVGAPDTIGSRFRRHIVGNE